MTLNRRTVPIARLDLSQIERKYRFDAWQTFNQGVFHISPNPEVHREHQANLTCYRLPHCVAGHCWHNGSVLSTSVKSSFNHQEFVALRVHKSGKMFCDVSEVRRVTSPSSIALFDFQRPISTATTPVEYYSLTLPYSEIGYDPSRHAGLIQVDANTPAGKLIAFNIEAAMELLATATPEDAATVFNGVIGLLAGILSPQLKDESLRDKHTLGVETAVRRFIRENLRNDALTADLICREIGTTRAVLYRMFKEEGGVAKTITSMRLKQAYKEISLTSPDRGVVGQVAKRWTFHDQAHFSRLFRQTFACTPSDIVGSALLKQQSSRSICNSRGGADNRLGQTLGELYTV